MNVYFFFAIIIIEIEIKFFLSSNNLTWRDMQHIVVLSAKRKNLEGNWMENGVGLNVSHWFGYGLINASAMVDYAREWVPVPEQTKCIFKGKVNELSKAK